MIRETFVTLNRARLFTADQVVDIVERECSLCERPDEEVCSRCAYTNFAGG